MTYSIDDAFYCYFLFGLLSFCFHFLQTHSILDKILIYVLEPAMGPCLCQLASGLVKKLQGTWAKASGPDCACACVSWDLAL
jgi:hypothetical protein